MIEAGISKNLNLNKPKLNWCPDCKSYTNWNHDCKAGAVRESSLGGDSRATSPPQGDVMETATGAAAAPKKAAKKTAAPKSGHRDALYLALVSKLKVDGLKGQAAKVATAILAFTTAKSLTEIVDKVKANGEYKVKAEGGVADSVHFHLRKFVADGLVKETKPE